MKNLLLCILFLSILPHVTSAQTEQYTSTVGFNMGWSLAGSLIDIAKYGTGANTESFVNPSYQISYDYAIENWISLGGAISRQTMGINYYNYSYTDDNGETQKEDFKFKVNRLNIGLRALIHYGPSKKLDMFSGVRLGFTNWNIDTNASNPLFNKTANALLNGLHVSPQIIVFGIRGYLINHLGANIEVAMGSPHFFSFGLNVSW